MAAHSERQIASARRAESTPDREYSLALPRESIGERVVVRRIAEPHMRRHLEISDIRAQYRSQLRMAGNTRFANSGVSGRPRLRP